MKIFYFLVLMNLVCTRYLNLEKLSSTYHNKKKSQFLNRHLENGDEVNSEQENLSEQNSEESNEQSSEESEKKSKETKQEKEQRKKKEFKKKLKRMEEKAIEENLNKKKVAEHENDVGYVNPIIKDTNRYPINQQDDQNQQQEEGQEGIQENEGEGQQGTQENEGEGKQISQDKSPQGFTSDMVKVTTKAIKVQVDELKKQEEDEVIKSIQNSLTNNQSRNPIIIINKPHQNLDQLIEQQKEKIEQIKQQQAQDSLPQYEPEIVGNTEANIDNKVYDEYGQVVSELSQVNDQQQDTSQAIQNNKHYKFVNGSFETNLSTDTVNFNDIDTLIDTLGTIQKLFDSYYELAPKESEIMMEQKQEKEENGMLDQTLRVLQIYKRIKDFANIVLTQGDELINDVHFLSQKVDKLKANEDDMLKFFNLQEKYYNVKLQASVYESQDSKFAKYFYEIHGISDTFNTNLKSVLREVFNIGKYTEFFMNTIHHMYNVTKFSSVIDVLKTIDQVLMMTLRLLEFHTDVTASVKQGKISLSNLKLQRVQILNSLDKIDTLTQYYKYGVVDDKPDNTKEIKKGSLVFKLSMIFTMFILV